LDKLETTNEDGTVEEADDVKDVGTAAVSVEPIEELPAGDGVFAPEDGPTDAEELKVVGTELVEVVGLLEELSTGGVI
jgi:hypothetical protein